MKIIDLLNKIANGEEVPKKIKIYDEFYYEYDKDIDYKSEDGSYLFSSCIEINKEDLNMEVEILEEKKIPEKIDNRYYDEVNKCYGGKRELSQQEIIDKINEIIDYLKSKGE